MEVAASAAAWKDVSVLRRSLLRRYETRHRRDLPPPVDQRPFRGRFRDAGTWEEWLLTCSLFERVDAAHHDIARGVRSRNPARIVGLKPYLNFVSPDAKNVEHYRSACRFGLLAYAAFPNSEWRTASKLMDLQGATCEALFAAFVSDEPLTAPPPPTEHWGYPLLYSARRGDLQRRWRHG